MADRMNEPIPLVRDEGGEPEARRVPPVVIAAGVGAAIVGLGLLSWMLYRSRRRRNLMTTLRDTVPQRVRAVPQRMRAMPRQVRALPSRVGELRGLSEELRGRLTRVR